MFWPMLLGCVGGPPATGDGTSGTDDGTDAGIPCDEVDADGDGVDACDDCEDLDSAIFPGAPERCDGRDTDCTGGPDPAETVDADADGVADCSVCEEAGFWSGTADLTGESLVTALHELTSDQDCASYSAETDYLFLMLDRLKDGTVECVYTGRHTSVGTEKPDPTDMNTEHTWPQSLGADVEPAKCDLHHLFVSDADANSARGNLLLTELSTVDTWWDETGESALGRTAAGDQAFEPRAGQKGNSARALLYFAMRYGYPVAPADLATWQAWNTVDPPDEAERARSMAIRARQGEANPYVVCDGLVDRL